MLRPNSESAGSLDVELQSYLEQHGLDEVIEVFRILAKWKHEADAAGKGAT